MDPLTNATAATTPIARRAESADAPQRGRQAAQLADGDRVELSVRAREERPVRRELVDRVKGEIADGTYLTRQKLHTAIDRFVAQLRSSRTTPMTQAG